MGMTDLQARFAAAGSYALDHGATLWWLLDDLGFYEIAPNCAILFPDGYVGFVVVRPGVGPSDVSKDTVEAFAKAHHPLRFVPNVTSAEAYWRKTKRRFKEESA